MNETVINVDEWINKHKTHFQPPVCNKMMHNEQLKVFYVGGPNKRLDYHLEEGEELFYMHKGTLVLKVLVNDTFQDVVVKEGEIFLLPAKIPHSPQRNENTIGLVIERERASEEQDCVRYFVKDSTQVLYDEWFHCEDLGTQLVPIIETFLSSKQYKTGKPIPDSLTECPPYRIDSRRKLELPINLRQWLLSNQEEIHATGWKRLYGTPYETDVIVYGRGQHVLLNEAADTFLWQLVGSATPLANPALKRQNDTLLIPRGTRFILNVPPTSLILAVTMDSRNKPRTLTA